jgi:hypothetical protein
MSAEGAAEDANKAFCRPNVVSGLWLNRPTQNAERNLTAVLRNPDVIDQANRSLNGPLVP